MAKSADAFRTISEVADWLELPTHVLRFWESKFSQVKPVKRAGGRRYYRPNDMLLLAGIKHLLHVEGMTIKAVQQKLRTDGAKSVAALSPPLEGSDPDAIQDLPEEDVELVQAAAPPTEDAAHSEVPEAPVIIDAAEEDFAPREDAVVLPFSGAEAEEVVAPEEDAGTETTAPIGADTPIASEDEATPFAAEDALAEDAFDAITDPVIEENSDVSPAPEDIQDVVENTRVEDSSTEVVEETVSASEEVLPSFLHTPLTEDTEHPDAEDNIPAEPMQDAAQFDVKDTPAPDFAEPVQEPEPLSTEPETSEPVPSAPEFSGSEVEAASPLVPAQINVPADPADYVVSVPSGTLSTLIAAKSLDGSQIGRIVPLYNRLGKLMDRMAQND